eukprot:TRINITY_DN2748_c0_g1_i5.p1 TRINITY_DN2748_c0_g1~~TRINITY_DN2748_c0_g1_i5.p1  ORF type:complete len:248 (+),score=58.82 TRINITY_DN2748_c0_g1_i5:657-1400(+)
MVRMLPREFDRISGHLSVDGVGVGILDVATLTTRYTTSVFEGWLGDVTGSSRSTRRFRVGLPRTKAVWGDGGAAADAEEDAATAAVGSAVLKWCPSRLTSSYVTPSSGLVPDDAPTLSEREAMKNRSLATGVGSSLATPSTRCSGSGRMARRAKPRRLSSFTGSRRVLVTRGILTEGGEVVPELRGKGGRGCGQGRSRPRGGYQGRGRACGGAGQGRGRGVWRRQRGGADSGLGAQEAESHVGDYHH